MISQSVRFCRISVHLVRKNYTYPIVSIIDPSLYADVAKLIFEQKSVEKFTTDTLVTFINEAKYTVIIAKADDAEKFQKAFEEADKTFGFSDVETKYGKSYTEMTAEQKTYLQNLMLESKAFTEPSKVYDTYETGVVLTLINTASYDEMEDITISSFLVYGKCICDKFAPIKQHKNKKPCIYGLFLV